MQHWSDRQTFASKGKGFPLKRKCKSVTNFTKIILPMCLDFTSVEGFVKLRVKPSQFWEWV